MQPLIRSTLGVLLALGLGVASASAGLTVPNFFSDHMVLQQGKPVPIWGWSDANAEVSVSFKGQTLKTTADENGNWEVKLAEMKADSEGAAMEIKSGDTAIAITDVLVGEVWFASGQSNMAFSVNGSHEAATDIPAADYPGIRMFMGALTPASEPQDNVDGNWAVCTPQTVPQYSAVAYFFAQRLHKDLGVPVGVIKSAWGGKPVETYTSREALMSTEFGKAQVEAMDASTANYDPAKAKVAYEKALAGFEEKLAEWRAKVKDLSPEERAKAPRAPRKPELAKPANVTEGQPTVLYNGMIAPYVGYAMRGAIWYQGEANSRPPQSYHYQEMFTLKIEDWRERWGDDFSYYFVQLANFKAPSTAPGVVDHWALLQDEQRKTLELEGTGMAVANDVGAADDIHPKDKKTVGNRLALWALAKDYGKDIVYTGPLYSGYDVEGNMVRVKFDSAKGLKSRDGGPLQRFEIAGEDKVWHWGDAVVDGNAVLVSSPKVEKPVAVRYAWASNPEGANLVNGEGLPASVFRTDDWEIPES